MSTHRRKPIATVYIDGFNLYHGCVKNTPYKWLDVGKLCRFLLPEYQVQRIRYFTAIVTDRPDKPGQSTRQLTYLRALETIPNLTIHRGFFLHTTVRARLVTPISCRATPACLSNLQTLEVYKTEEKGSDVNIATYLLLDAFDNGFDVAWVISNDSDLAFPIDVVRRRFNKEVGILNPRNRLARGLKVPPSLHRTIRPRALAACQFPAKLTDRYGTIHKPATW